MEQRAREKGDFDMNKLTYYGLSWGTWISPVMLAVEDRIGSAILLAGGFPSWEPPEEESDPAIFAPRVEIPILMVNAWHDGFFPVETHVQPMFNLLGTPEPEKKLILRNGGHIMLGLFYWEIQNDVLAWLDKYPKSEN
jgi:hypothetical protein